jgi:hypothetical protein
MHVAFLSENLHASHARLQLPPTIIISFDKMKRNFFLKRFDSRKLYVRVSLGLK